MDYLKILHEDSNLAADFDALFDFFLLDEPTKRDEVEGRCTFSLDGKAFARDGAGGEYHQLEDGSIGYVSSEGQCGRIAESVDDLIHFDQTVEKISIPPKGKHLFGTVKVGDRGQIVLPKRARDIFHIKSGDLLVVLGDETPEHAGIALVPGDSFLQTVEFLQSAMRKRNDTEALETEGIK